MNYKIRMKNEFKDLESRFDGNTYYAERVKINPSILPISCFKRERHPTPPPPPLTPKPQRNFEIGMKINISQFKSLPDPFITEKNKISTIDKEDLKTESRVTQNSQNVRNARSDKINSLKRRRNSASSDSSQCSSSSSQSCSSEEDRLEIDDEPRERARSRATNISNRKRLRIRDEIGKEKKPVYCCRSSFREFGHSTRI